MALNLFKGKASAPQTRTRAPSADYIDLEEYTKDHELFDATASMMVRVAEIRSYDDLREYANYVYKGNMLLLDFSAIANDDVVLKRVTADLQKLVADINGDLAGFSKTTMIVAPTGVKIDRTKARGRS